MNLLFGYLPYHSRTFLDLFTTILGEYTFSTASARMNSTIVMYMIICFVR